MGRKKEGNKSEGNMSRLVRDAKLETREARRKLQKRKVPYWRIVVEGIHLGYYKGKHNGMWYAKARTPEGKYIWLALGVADDFSDADGTSVLNYSQAQDQAKIVGNKIRHGEDLQTNEYAVNDATKDYLESFIANGKKSLYSTKKQIETHISPVFGEKIVSTLTYRQLDTWKNKLATSDKRLRTGLGKIQKFKPDDGNDPEYLRRRRVTANRIITIFKAILNHAFKTDRVKSNEAWQKLKPFKNVSEPKIRFLNEKDSLRLLNACEPDFKLLVRGALLTGTRYGELTTLKVSDYTDNNTIYIHQSKSGKPRHIPLNEEGIKFFDQLIVGKKSSDLIFTRSNFSAWKKNYQVRPLEAACEIAKIIPAITFHDLRHTYASALAMKGVPLQVIAAVLGHSDTRITHKHYAHLMPSYIADVIRQHLPNFGLTEQNNVQPIQRKNYK